jgi:hypothetical protein
VIIYQFNYTIRSTVPLNTPIRQPTDSHYATMCGAVADPLTVVKPYTIDLCGHFPSVNDGDVQLLMRTIGKYYRTHRISIISQRK